MRNVSRRLYLGSLRCPDPFRAWRLAALAVTVVLGGSLLPTTTGSAASPQTIVVDGTGAGRTFDGVGAISGGGGNSRLLIDYPEPQRSQVLDYLFKPGYGASLHILKVEIGGDTNSTDGAESSHMHTAGDLDCNRGYEWWLMEQAKARNPAIKLYGLAWGGPGWLGSSFFTQNSIDYLVAWLGCAAQHNLSIDYLGGWNEKGFNESWYESLHSTLASRGFHTQVVAADMVGWSVADAMVATPAFGQAVDIVGVHYPCGYRKPQLSCTSSASAMSTGKPLWASESGADDYNAGAPAAARGIIRGYLDSRMTAYINWPLVASIYPNLPFKTTGLAVADQPWSGSYRVGRLAWVIAQTTQFTQPGWRYLDSASGFLGGSPATGSYVTLRSATTGDYSSILETADATAPQTVTLSVQGGLSTGPVHLWTTSLTSTNPADYFVQLADPTPVGGSFTVTLQPGHIYSVTTTSGQGKGNASSPPPAALPLPYSDGFEDDVAGREPRYLAQQQGAFEVVACGGGRLGQCVRRMAPVAPIAWDRPANPYALLGGLGWTNYTVSTDVLLEQPGAVQVMGRVGAQRSKNVSGINAYVLQVSDAGAWSIIRNSRTVLPTTLASGRAAALHTGTWHHLSLSFAGATITAAIDGTRVGTVQDTTYGAGQLGLGVAGYQTDEFDNLSVR